MFPFLTPLIGSGSEACLFRPRSVVVQLMAPIPLPPNALQKSKSVLPKMIFIRLLQRLPSVTSHSGAFFLSTHPCKYKFSTKKVCVQVYGVEEQQDQSEQWEKWSNWDVRGLHDKALCELGSRILHAYSGIEKSPTSSPEDPIPAARRS